jgi:hypothetical protein
MAQLFPRSFNNLSRFTLYGAFACLAFTVWMAVEIYNSNYVTGIEMPPEQPVPFSHKHHVGDDGIDCRYCHTSVETSNFAGIPPTETCMTCHSELWKNSPILEPVYVSYRTNTSIPWERVHRLADYVYFNHSIHIQKGIGCSFCHGAVDTMPLTWRTSSLRMEWCLGCHREPQAYIRPRSQVFNMGWTPPENQIEMGRNLVKEYNIATTRITDCYTCHR